MTIAGEDVDEEELMPEAETALIEGIPGYDEEARTIFTGGLAEETIPEEPIGEVE